MLASEHAWPQVPQLFASVWRLWHTVPHWVCPTGQVQTPVVHGTEPVHATPHAPQLAASLAVSTQTPPQSVRPGPHTHVPAEHT